MAQTVLTAEMLSQFEQNIGQQKSRLDQIEKEMNKLLNGGFLWDDPIAQGFRASYAQHFEPLRAKLFPAMERYQVFLKELHRKTVEWEADKITI